MLLTARQPIVETYRVEVSGWDSSQAFFVEKTELEWSEESGKQITLNRELRADTMIFVRLLQTTVTDRGFPVAYKAAHVGNLPGGLNQFRLQQVAPATIGTNRLCTGSEKQNVEISHSQAEKSDTRL